MSKGAWTCLPFLSLDPEMAPRLTTKHWLFGYDGARYRHSAITRFALKVDEPIQFGPPEDPQRAIRYQNWLQAELIRREDYAERYNAQEKEHIEPLDRRINRFILDDKAKEARATRKRIKRQKRMRTLKQEGRLPPARQRYLLKTSLRRKEERRLRRKGGRESIGDAGGI
jgi:hypothetical protein